MVNHPEIPDLGDRIQHVIEYDIEQEYVNNLIDSTPERLEEVASISDFILLEEQLPEASLHNKLVRY